MVFLSLEFAIAFVFLLVILFWVKNIQLQQYILLGFSYLFYAYIDGRFLLLLLLETIVVFFACQLMNRCEKWKKLILTCSVSGVVLVLGICKYLEFFVQSVSSLFGIENGYTLELLIPLGISFFSFQAISILVDTYRGDVRENEDFVKVALGIGIFTQITSGPIVTARKMFTQLQQPLLISNSNLSLGFQLILSGIVKKKIIADRLAIAVEAVYSKPEVYHGGTLLFTACVFMIQLYMDFAGYSDIAIGLAKMMGLEIGPNFDMPFLAKNTAEFWHRWHISLSSWFKEYVYFPLGGSRKGLPQTCINLFLVMVLSGLWHGASWNYVLWGILFGVTNVAQKLFDAWKKKCNIKLHGAWQRTGNVISVACCYFVTSLFFIFFRADSFELSCIYLKRIFTWADGVSYYYFYGIVFALLIFVVEMWMYRKNNGHYVFVPLDLTEFRGKLIVCCIIWLIVCFAFVGGDAFLYAQF